MRIPFGRLMLFFLITAVLFGVFGLFFALMNPFFEFYKAVASVSLMAAAVCLVMWLIITLFKPRTLFEPGSSLSGAEWVDVIFRRPPYLRLALISLVVSLTLFWIHSLVFPVVFTLFLASIEMVFARLLFVIYGSAGRR